MAQAGNLTFTCWKLSSKPTLQNSVSLGSVSDIQSIKETHSVLVCGAQKPHAEAMVLSFLIIGPQICAVQWPHNMTAPGAEMYHDSKFQTKHQKSCSHRLHAQDQNKHQDHLSNHLAEHYTAHVPQDNGNRNQGLCW